MDASSNQQLQVLLQSIEGSFLDAVVAGPESLTKFVQRWSTLQKALAVRGRSLSLDEETLALAATVARNITIMGDNFLELETKVASLQSNLMSETQAVLEQDLPRSTHRSTPCGFHRLSKPSLQSPRHPASTPITCALSHILPSRNPSSAASVTESTRSASDPNPLPEFIEHAYKFFVANIFNPYPSREEKQTIVDKTNNTRVTLTSVSNWFTNARRRCGWAEILKRRCNGNRDEMVDLAKRVFVKPDPRHPVDAQTTAEFMEMKENIESMYERKTRTSAWIDDLGDLHDLINPIPEEERLATKRRDTEAEREARRQEKEAQKEQREFERQKRKMQAEALRKADKVAKLVQREQEKEKKREQRVASFAVPHPPKAIEDEDEDIVSESVPVAGGKRKLEADAPIFYNSPGRRHASPASSLSSAFTSDFSSDGRVPSLTWSESGDERPYKRNRPSPTSHTDSSRLSPTLEVPTSFDYSFTFDPPAGLTDDPSAFESIFDFSVNPSDTIVSMPRTPSRGQKRQHDTEDGEPTPQAKRARPLVASTDSEWMPATSTSLFTPTPSVNGSPTQIGRRRSSLVPFDLDTVLGLDQTQPQPVQITPPDASIPLDVGVFDWSACANPGMDQFGGDPQADFSQLFQIFSEQLPSDSEPHLAPLKVSEHSEQQLDAHVEMLSFDIPASNALPQQQLLPSFSSPTGHSLDLSGLMSGLISDEAFNDMGLDFSTSVPSTPPNLSRSSSLSPAWTSASVTPAPESFPTPVELADKALNKERKRRELEEKRAALERERARLAEMERELEED